MDEETSLQMDEEELNKLNEVIVEEVTVMEEVMEEVTEGIPIPVEGTYYGTIDEALDMYTKYAEMAGFEVKKGGQRKTKSGAVQHKYIYCNKQGVPKEIPFESLVIPLESYEIPLESYEIPLESHVIPVESHNHVIPVESHNHVIPVESHNHVIPVESHEIPEEISCDSTRISCDSSVLT
ncbi:hypothetical protein Tco_0671519, partial [Tanacetum coccineum]